MERYFDILIINQHTSLPYCILCPLFGVSGHFCFGELYEFSSLHPGLTKMASKQPETQKEDIQYNKVMRYVTFLSKYQGLYL